MRPRPPNILFILTDQQRWDALGCVGGWVETPHIDRLAADGVRFSNAYTNSPECFPARVSLALGRYPHDTGVRSNRPRYALPGEAPVWMRAVREAGYATSMIGKLHLHPHRGDVRDREELVHAYGFDHVDEVTGPRASLQCRSNLTDLWEAAGVARAYRRDMADRVKRPWVARPTPLPFELYPDVYIGRQAASWLRNYDGSKPWFSWVGFGGPHEPWDVPEPYASRYDPAAMPPPVRPVDDGHVRPQGLLDERQAMAGRARARSEAGQLEPQNVARLRASYAGSVTLIDDQVGQLLRAVEDRGELDRTLVVFASDHGELNGDYDLLFKQAFLNGAARVPLVIRPTADMDCAAPGAVADTMVELMDVGATIAEIAGGAPNADSRARSLMPVMSDSSRTIRPAALCEYLAEQMVATPDWKLALNEAGEAYMLFDLRADPSETHNLAGLHDYREIEQELRALMPPPAAEHERSPPQRFAL